MGACCSPSNAGLYLGKWEEDFVFNLKRNSFLLTHIDDVRLFLSGSEGEHLDFHAFLNGINPNIKFPLQEQLPQSVI